MKLKGYRWYMFFSNDNSSIYTDNYTSYFSMDGDVTGLARGRIRFEIGDEDITGDLSKSATGIKGIGFTDKEEGNEPVYSLSGSRVASSLSDKSLAPGIYVTGGRKVVIK